jgi:DNA-binding transcriptional MerR regulator
MRLKIKQVSEITGITSSDLRNWERHYGFPTPSRSKTGQRLYNSDEVQALIKVRHAQQNGKSARKLKLVYQDGLNNKNDDLIGPQPDPSLCILPAVKKLIHALTDFDLQNAEDLLQQLHTLYDINGLVKHIFLPALKLVGDHWEISEINVTQEHFATNFIRSKLYHYATRPIGKTPLLKCALATLEGEAHEGAILALSILLKQHRVESFYLGQGLPIIDLLHSIKKMKIDFLCLSFCSNDIDSFALDLLEAMPIPIFIGGKGINPQKAPLPRNVFYLKEPNFELQIEKMLFIQKNFDY